MSTQRGSRSSGLKGMPVPVRHLGGRRSCRAFHLPERDERQPPHPRVNIGPQRFSRNQSGRCSSRVERPPGDWIAGVLPEHRPRGNSHEPSARPHRRCGMRSGCGGRRRPPAVAPATWIPVAVIPAHGCAKLAVLTNSVPVGAGDDIGAGGKRRLAPGEGAQALPEHHQLRPRSLRQCGPNPVHRVEQRPASQRRGLPVGDEATARWAGTSTACTRSRYPSRR